MNEFNRLHEENLRLVKELDEGNIRLTELLNEFETKLNKAEVLSELGGSK